MRYKKITRVFCFFISLLCVLSVFSLTTFAASTIDATDVMSDLESMSDFDLEQYSKNEKDTYISLITLDEYGYDYNGFSNDYGLYVYVYNPSGRKILDNKKAKIQIAISENSKGDPVYEKYDLTLLSYSTKPGYEHVFYKYKVNIPSSFYTRLTPSKRVYKLSGIEFQRYGELSVEEYEIGSTITYTGFSSYHGPNIDSEHSTLYCKVERLETVSLELHPASWKTISSDKGYNHQYEVSSVYFAVPNYWLDKYGSKDDLYKGLYGLTAEWYEYLTNGLLTNNDHLYSDAKAIEAKYVPAKADSVPFTFRCKNCNKAEPCSFNYNSLRWPEDLNPLSSLYCSYAHGIYFLYNVIKINKGDFDGLSAFETMNKLKREDGSYNHFGIRADDGRIPGYNRKSFTINDGSLNSQINSYASNHIDFITVIKDFINNSGDHNQDSSGYDEIDVFKKITSIDFDDGTSAENAEKLFISVEDYINLRTFYNSHDPNEYTVYLLRFAVTDYVMAPIVVRQYDPLAGFDEDYYGTENFYFEKTIFLDFDVLDMTFYNEEQGYKLLPISSKPIDLIGSISTGTSSSGNNRFDLSGLFKDLGSDDPLNQLVGLFQIICFAVVLFVVFYFLFKLFGALKKKGSNRKNSGGSGNVIIVQNGGVEQYERKNKWNDNKKNAKKKDSEKIISTGDERTDKELNLKAAELSKAYGEVTMPYKNNKKG